MKENNLKFIKNKFAEFEKKIGKLKSLEKELDSLDTEGFEPEVKAIKSMLKSPDKIPVIEKRIEELKEKIVIRVPSLSVNRSTSEISIKEGDKLEVKIELKNEGEDVVKSISLLDKINKSLEISSGENSWTGDLNPHESKLLKYIIKADRAGKYTIPPLIVLYKDIRGKTYEKSTNLLEIEVISKEEAKVEPPPKNAYGVVIGIGTYKDPDIPILKYAKDDALEIYNILTDPKYGNFPKENVKLLLDEKATLTEIKSAMGTFLARKAGKDDIVCIYFAGHGSPEIDPTGKADDKLEKFIVPYDAKKNDLFGYGFSMDEIHKIFERLESMRVVFFIDSCYSGHAGGRTFSRSDVISKNIAISEKFLEDLSGEGRIIFTACKPDELALETEELKHGIFTYYLAEGLKGKADLNEDGVVTTDELIKYVSGKVKEKARQLGGKQNPLKSGTFVDEIPLTRYETEKMRIIKQLNSAAIELFEKKEHDAAIKNWEEVLKIDSENSEALAGIRKFEERQRKLIELHQKGLPTEQFNEAMTILKKNLSACTEKERKISDYIEQMLNGDISFENYIDIRKLMR